MKLVKTQKEIEVALKAMLGFFHSYLIALKLPKEEAVAKTIETYDDFAEWLQGKV